LGAKWKSIIVIRSQKKKPLVERESFGARRNVCARSAPKAEGSTRRGGGGLRGGGNSNMSGRMLRSREIKRVEEIGDWGKNADTGEKC